jgi:hypothetical protein
VTGLLASDESTSSSFEAGAPLRKKKSKQKNETNVIDEELFQVVHPRL